MTSEGKGSGGWVRWGCVDALLRFRYLFLYLYTTNSGSRVIMLLIRKGKGVMMAFGARSEYGAMPAGAAYIFLITSIRGVE